MATTDTVEGKIQWLVEMQTDLELGESLEQKHGLDFTETEKALLKMLRERLPEIKMVFAKVHSEQ
jgi:hypothetical protein